MSINWRFWPLLCTIMLMTLEKFWLAWKKGFVRFTCSSFSPLLDPSPSSTYYRPKFPIGLPLTSSFASGSRNFSNNKDDDRPRLKHSIPLCLSKLYLSWLITLSVIMCLVPSIWRWYSEKNYLLRCKTFSLPKLDTSRVVNRRLFRMMRSSKLLNLMMNLSLYGLVWELAREDFDWVSFCSSLFILLFSIVAYVSKETNCL